MPAANGVPNRIQAPAVLIYGQSGVGKSTSAIRALTPERTLWISTERGAIKPASNPDLNPWHPRRPREIVCLAQATGPNDLSVAREFNAAVEKALEMVQAGEIANLVIDTISSYATRLDHLVHEVIGIPREYGRASRAVGSAIYPRLRRIYQTVASVERPRRSANAPAIWGATLVCLAHEKEPFQAAADRHTGAPAKTIAGGPALPGKIAETVRHDFDLVLRADIRSVGMGRAERVFAHDS